MATKITAAGLRTLRTVAANGGEVPGRAGQRGISLQSMDKLVRDGYLERRGPGHAHGWRITEAGRAAIA
jgi:hypothetical protein